MNKIYISYLIKPIHTNTHENINKSLVVIIVKQKKDVLMK